MVSEPESGWSSWFSSSFNLCDGGKNCTDFSTQHSAWHITSMGWVVATLTVAVTVCNSEMSSRTLRGFPETMARRVLTADVFLPSPSLISESKHSSGGGLQMILQPGQALLWWPLSQLFASLRREASGNRKRYTHTHTHTHAHSSEDLSLSCVSSFTEHLFQGFCGWTLEWGRCPWPPRNYVLSFYFNVQFYSKRSLWLSTISPKILHPYND